jgi:hypothetical protein
VKAGKDEKVCRYRFPTGEVKTWVCKKEQPCCAWDLFSYVKCGSTSHRLPITLPSTPELRDREASPFK